MSLTRSALRDILIDGKLVDCPILQLAEMKPQKNNLHKAALSDGTNYASVMLGSQVKPLIENGSINKNCLLKISKYVLSKNPKHSMIVISCELVSHSPALIGKPTPIQAIVDTSMPNAMPVPQDLQLITTASSISNVSSTISANTSPSPNKVQLTSPNRIQSKVTSAITMSIANLNTYIQSWSIIARITTKSALREYKGAKPGKLFSIIIKDKANSEIKGTFFNAEADKFYEEIEEGGIYKISGGKVKQANPKFNNTKNDLEINFDHTTTFQSLPDDGTIPGLTLTIVSLDQLSNYKAGTTVDICAVVVLVEESSQITTKKGTQATKRRVEICDKSLTKVDLTLWGDIATSFDSNEGDIIVVSSVQVSDFHGKSLNLGIGSSICKNQNLPLIGELRTWWNSLEDKSSLVSVSSSSTSFSSSLIPSIQIRRLVEIDEKALCKSEAGDTFSACVMVVEANTSRKPVYLACPNESCHNVGIQMNEDGQYLCKRCSQIIKNPKPRFAFNIKVSDYSGSVYVSILGDDTIGSTITGMTAEEIYQIPEDNLANELIKKCFFNIFQMKIKGKPSTFKDNSIQMTILSANAVNFGASALELAEQIDTQFE